MTKQDSAMEQPTSKQQTTGKTDSDENKRVLPWWREKELSEKEQLRRQFKKHYGFKPCGMSVEALRTAVEKKERKPELY